MDLNKLKIHCSSIGSIMTEPQSKADKDAGNLSKTAQAHCVGLYTEFQYNRRQDAYSKYLDKGNFVEEDSITLLSVLQGRFYSKNTGVFQDSHLIGTPDILTTEGDKVTIVDDVKSSYDIFSFQNIRTGKIDPKYEGQLLGYMALTGAKEGFVRHCLVNATPALIEDEKRALMYKMRASPSDEAYIEKCGIIERNMIYDMELFRKQHPDYIFTLNLSEWNYDIPAKERLHTFRVERDEEKIKAIYQRVEKARQFIQTLMP